MSSFLVVVASILFALISVASAYDVNHNIPSKLPKNEFFHFRTRPDILVPRWEVTTYEKELLSPGYWFTAPYEELSADASTKVYVGPQIYDDNGELVWSSTDMFHNADIFDFRIAHMNGRAQITLISLYAQSAVILDDSYNVVKRFPIGRFGESANMHDFNIVDNGTRALTLHRNITFAPLEQSMEVGYHGGQCRVSSHYVTESDTTDPQHWKRLFTWHMLDHVRLNESTYARNDIENECRNDWDFLHANSIDKCPDGNFVLSTRNADTIYKVSHTDGSIMWRFGGTLSDFTSNFRFSRQHHVRCHESNETHTLITFLDNANGKDGVPTNPFSRGMRVQLDTEHMTATKLVEYPHPFKGIQGARGSCEVLPTGNVLMGWSDRSLVSEHAADGRVIQAAQMIPTWIRTYRSYKFPFVGRPTRSPDVVSEVHTSTHSPSQGSSNNAVVEAVRTQVFASWNGATEVSYWSLYKTDATGETRRLVASVPRNGFETEIVYEGFANYVIVEALDGNGNVLDFGRSPVIKTSIPGGLVATSAFAGALDAEAYWLQSAEYDKHHPWLAKAKTVAAEPWSMFIGGVFASAGVLVGLWLAVRFRSKRPSWWRRRAEGYQTVREDEAEAETEPKSDAYAVESLDCDVESSAGSSLQTDRLSTEKRSAEFD